MNDQGLLSLDLESFLKEVRTRVGETLLENLPQEGRPQKFRESLTYVVKTGGKRLRPALLILCGLLHGAKLEPLLKAAASYEVIHLHSLVIDDLPVMDDDDMRRGQPTCHKAFGEDIALLTGLAFNSVSLYLMDARLKDQMAKLQGFHGISGGQALDILFLKKQIDPDRDFMLDLHYRKTAVFYEVMAVSGLILAEESEENQKKIACYGKNLGLLFQVTDDELDDNEYMNVVGREQTLKDMEMFVEDGIAAIEYLGDRGRLLKDFMYYVRDREE